MVVLAVPAGLGFLTAFFSRDHRGLHDRFAGTRVVRACDDVIGLGFGHRSRLAEFRRFSPPRGVGYAAVCARHIRIRGRACSLVAAPAIGHVQGTAIVVLFVAGSWSGGVAERHFGRTDPGQVVIDEVMGMLITLFLNPVGWAGAFAGVPAVSRRRHHQAVSRRIGSSASTAASA